MNKPFISYAYWLNPHEYYEITIKYSNEETFTYTNLQFIEFVKQGKVLKFIDTDKKYFALYNGEVFISPHEIIEAKELID